MEAPGWLTQRLVDVPAGSDWLGSRECLALAALPIEQRRVAWRLGRWTAKAALGAWLGVAPAQIEVLASADGAPEPWVDGQRLPVSISISHRGGWGLASVASSPHAMGCDLELIEPRSDAFVREWFSEPERRLVRSADQAQRALLANLLWTAKEATAKVRREGLRLDLRQTFVHLADAGAAEGRWSSFRVDFSDDAGPISGWWRYDAGLVMAVAGDPPTAHPRKLGQP